MLNQVEAVSGRIRASEKVGIRCCNNILDDVNHIVYKLAFRDSKDYLWLVIVCFTY